METKQTSQGCICFAYMFITTGYVSITYIQQQSMWSSFILWSEGRKKNDIKMIKTPDRKRIQMRLFDIKHNLVCAHSLSASFRKSAIEMFVTFPVTWPLIQRHWQQPWKPPFRASAACDLHAGCRQTEEQAINKNILNEPQYLLLHNPPLCDRSVCPLCFKYAYLCQYFDILFGNIAVSLGTCSSAHVTLQCLYLPSWCLRWDFKMYLDMMGFFWLH